MNKMYKICFVFLLFLLSCSNNYKINKFQKKVEITENKIESLTSKDWLKFENDFKEFSTYYDQNKDNFSSEERKTANKLIGKCNKLFLKRTIKDVEKNLNDFNQQLEGLLE